MLRKNIVTINDHRYVGVTTEEVGTLVIVPGVLKITRLFFFEEISERFILLQVAVRMSCDYAGVASSERYWHVVRVFETKEAANKYLEGYTNPKVIKD